KSYGSVELADRFAHLRRRFELLLGQSLERCAHLAASALALRFAQQLSFLRRVADALEERLHLERARFPPRRAARPAGLALECSGELCLAHLRAAFDA